jgi:PAS domain-containing protein
MMELVGRFGDVLTLVCSTAAFTLLLTTVLRRPSSQRSVASWLLLAAIGVYVVISLSDLLIALNLTRFFEPFDDYLEVLFPLLVVGVAFAHLSARRYEDALRAEVALARSHELTMDIVEEAPAGIIFLDETGSIAFANTVAKGVLEIGDEADRSTTPAWTLAGPWGNEPGLLVPLVHHDAYDGLPISLSWPDGRSVDLRVSGRPVAQGIGGEPGVVVTFERPEAVTVPTG